MLFRSLKSALAARDAERFRRAAHSLKSNSNTFGALTLGSIAKDLELGGMQSALGAGAHPLAALESEYAEVAAALKALRHG